jgi:hypothetical protein
MSDSLRSFRQGENPDFPALEASFGRNMGAAIRGLSRK